MQRRFQLGAGAESFGQRVTFSRQHGVPTLQGEGWADVSLPIAHVNDAGVGHVRRQVLSQQGSFAHVRRAGTPRTRMGVTVLYPQLAALVEMGGIGDDVAEVVPQALLMEDSLDKDGVGIGDDNGLGARRCNGLQCLGQARERDQPCDKL